MRLGLEKTFASLLLSEGPNQVLRPTAQTASFSMCNVASVPTTGAIGALLNRGSASVSLDGGSNAFTTIQTFVLCDRKDGRFMLRVSCPKLPGVL